MGRVVNWHKYRRQMTPSQRKREDYIIWLKCLVWEINNNGVHKDLCVELLKEQVNLLRRYYETHKNNSLCPADYFRNCAAVRRL
jgi:hypothetical protein